MVCYLLQKPKQRSSTTESPLSNDTEGIVSLALDDKSKVNIKVQQAIKQMDKINHSNWQYLVMQTDSTMKAISDFESMLVGNSMKDL